MEEAVERWRVDEDLEDGIGPAHVARIDESTRAYVGHGAGRAVWNGVWRGSGGQVGKELTPLGFGVGQGRGCW